MRININITALNAHRNLEMNATRAGKNMEKLSSGRSINRASDNAAGLSISEKMSSQIRGLRQASKNSLDGVSLIQTAEGALSEVHNMLQRMRELAVQAANGSNADKDKEAIQSEITQLTEEIDEVGKKTEFNGLSLLTGSLEKGIVVQTGANKEQSITLEMPKISKSELGITDIKVATGATAAISVYDTAIETVSTSRSKLGALQNRLEKTIANLDNTAENLTSAMSRISDTDMALSMAEFTKLNVLQQAGTAMLSQANQIPQMLLKLLNA